ncbi:hypothetical protein H2O64_14710 [Kordia sp. YSTF-M3]|uniref:Uncharacterized protein n=1 Tax=Kordia aestuariivivens TaxID=2759037 RepID=A0ABR7QBG7_9FLAO|nr:hypothetical protein [Kordia aestuariivivens]MBC8755927.1 hypothetical protein [Kordia aestuariivivens]
MKKKGLTSLQLQKKSISNYNLTGGLQAPLDSNYTRANCERSRPASICHCH